jgi:hypothetical protein
VQGSLVDKWHGLSTVVGSSANRSTIASYDRCAADYARSTAPSWDGEDRRVLTQFRDALPQEGSVLEIGSGPGWDADWLESQGVELRRTDAAPAFVELQIARGALAERLDVITDDIGGPYAGVVALYVFQHIDRADLPHVLAKISQAIVIGGALLLSLREGGDDFVESGSSSGMYSIAEWRKADLDGILATLGFHERWSESSEDEDGQWLTILTCKDQDSD